MLVKSIWSHYCHIAMLYACLHAFVYLSSLIVVSCKIRIFWEILHGALKKEISIFLFSFVQVKIKTEKSDEYIVYTIFACLYCELVKTNTLIDSRFSLDFHGLSTKQFSNMTIQNFKTNLKEPKAKLKEAYGQACEWSSKK